MLGGPSFLHSLGKLAQSLTKSSACLQPVFLFPTFILSLVFIFPTQSLRIPYTNLSLASTKWTIQQCSVILHKLFSHYSACVYNARVCRALHRQIQTPVSLSSVQSKFHSTQLKQYTQIQKLGKELDFKMTTERIQQPSKNRLCGISPHCTTFDFCIFLLYITSSQLPYLQSREICPGYIGNACTVA